MITVKDILNFNPELYQELEELAKVREETNKLKRVKKAQEKGETQGMCEECGDNRTLYRFNGMLICDSCRSSL